MSFSISKMQNQYVILLLNETNSVRDTKKKKSGYFLKIQNEFELFLALRGCFS